SGAKVFSVLDLRKAFYNLKVHPDCRKFLTINTPYGSFSYNSIVEGFHSSPTSFTKYISLILSRIPNIFIYIDDILIATPTHEEHLKVLEMVFDRLNYFNLKLSADKCKIAQPKVTYLGFDVTEGFMLPSEDKSLSILNNPKPKTIKNLHSFLGSINYFQSSLPGISNTISPLLSFLKGAPYSQRRVKWNPEAEEAFNQAKLTLKNATPLGFLSN
ncbi:Transposon Ty3-G Gag-Pol polyprotein, partial [Dictyocoela muelleri]